MTLGIDPKDPTDYLGVKINVVPVVEAGREPAVTDRKFPMWTEWRIKKDPSSGEEGDFWKLVKFQSGDAIWRKFSSGGSGPTITISDTADTQVSPTPGGNIQLFGSAGITITADPGNNRLIFALSGGGPSIDTISGNTGSVVPDGAGQVNIVGNTTQGISSNGDGLQTLTFTIADWSETQKGVGTLASNAEAIAGTVNNEAIVPTSLKAKLGTQTNGGIAIGAGDTAAITWTAQPTNGQLLIGSTGVSPVLATLTAGAGIMIANGAGSITISANNTFPQPGVSNLGIDYNAGTGTFSVTSQNGTALSASNPGYVTLQSKSDPGQIVTVAITANQDFIDDNGASQIIGNLFNLTTGVATSVDIPFFLYAVLDDTETAIAFMISRFPNATTSPVNTKIGMPSTPAADTQGSFFSFENVTATSYDQNPCLSIGSFRMRMSAADDWTVQTLAARDGIGHFQEGLQFSFPRGQFGAASGKVFKNNGGTAPDDADGGYTYYIDSENNRIFFQLAFPATDTAGVGAVNLQLALAFTRLEGATNGGGYYTVGGAYTFMSGYTVPSTNTTEFAFVNPLGTGILTNASVGAGVGLGLNGTIGIEYS